MKIRRQTIRARPAVPELKAEPLGPGVVTRWWELGASADGDRKPVRALDIDNRARTAQYWHDAQENLGYYKGFKWRRPGPRIRYLVRHPVCTQICALDRTLFMYRVSSFDRARALAHRLGPGTVVTRWHERYRAVGPKFLGLSRWEPLWFVQTENGLVPCAEPEALKIEADND